MKNYKPKSKIVIEEITREMSKPRAPSVEVTIIDVILSYRRINVDAPKPRVEL